MAMLRLPTRTLYGSALTGKENIGMVHWYNSIFRLLSIHVYIYIFIYIQVIICVCDAVCMLIYATVTRAQKIAGRQTLAIQNWPAEVHKRRVR